MPPGNCKLTEAQTKQAENLILTMIQPELERRVNDDTSYVDLRRVYSSRVAAEYIRRQDAVSPTDFRKIINSNDVKRWPLRGENKDWDKKTVYDSYVHSFKNGDYKFERVYDGKVWILSMGGVDFSKAPKKNITRTQFNTQHRGLDKTTRTSVQSEVTYQDSETAYFGGSTSDQQTSPEDPKPTPTPTGPDDPKPTDPPSTPAPGPSTPGGDTTPPAKDPDGDLADTGNSTPVGLIAAAAAALAVAGGGLTWWMRRRRASGS